MKTFVLSSLTIFLVILTACSQESAVVKEEPARSIGKRTAPIYLEASLPIEVSLDLAVTVAMNLRVPAGADADLVITHDAGLQVLAPDSLTFQLAGTESGEHSFSVDVLPLSAERQYLRVFVEVAGQGRSFSFPIASVVAQAAIEIQNKRQAGEQGIIVLPAEER